MTPIKNAKLAFRCNEDLDGMTPCVQGKHCGACNKTVFDFRKSNLEELSRVIETHGAICGIFNDEQLVKPKSFSSSFLTRLTRTFFIALGLGVFSKALMAQRNTNDTVKKAAKTEVQDSILQSVNFGVVEVSPVHISGSDRGFGDFLKKHLKNPDNVEGRVIVIFIVDTNGRTSNVRVLRGLSKATDKEAIRVLKFTKFRPGTQLGKKVRVAYTCPIAFKKSKPNK